MVRLVDPATGQTTVIMSQTLLARNLLTDSLMVGFEDFESINKFSWIPLELIDFFRIDSRTYVAKKQSKWMARKNNAHFMQLDRNRHSDTKNYIHGRGSQRQYSAEKADGVM